MKNKLFIILALSMLVFSILACGETPTTGASQQPAAAGHTVKIEVTGTASSVDITYQDLASNDPAQDSGRAVPYWRSWANIPDGTFVYISAQNDDDSGSVTCEITVDGILWKTTTSNGGYVICTSSGILGF